MDDFRRLLLSICNRPAMYVGDGLLRHVAIYLDGYMHGAEHPGARSPFAGWRDWIEMRFLISHPAWHWTSILRAAYGSDNQVLAALPALYDDYRRDLDLMGENGIAEERARRLVERYGSTDYAPPEAPRWKCSENEER